jgi:hypothetical protein
MVDEYFYRSPEVPRGRHIPVEDLIVRHEKRIAADEHLTSYLCPCTKCHGGYRKSLKTIDIYREEYGRDEHLLFSMLGGDPVGGFPPAGIWINDFPNPEQPDNVFEDEDLPSPSVQELDPYHDVQQHIEDAFGEGDRLRESTTEAEVHNGEEELGDEEYSARLDLLDELTREATQPLYEGLNVSIVSATIVLINMAVIHSVPNEYLNELLKYLSTVLLPRGNRLPRSYYEAKSIIKKLGLNYKQIHSCPSGCVLFRNEYENLSKCPKPGCRKARYMPNSKSSPVRVVRWFPIIPRILRMFRSPSISKLFRFYQENRNNDEGVMKSVVDSPAWKHVTSEHVDPSFGNEPRNLRFGLSLDGVNPFPHTNSTHSTWPILLLIYNLSPFLVTKKFFIQLCILISGKDSPNNENIGVFIAPLIEELQLLWSGVRAQDVLNQPGERTFTLRGILLWTVSDYPALGVISGLSTHGYKACVPCGPETDSRSARTGNKLDDHQKAKGKPKRRDPPLRLTGEQTVRHVEERQHYRNHGGREGGIDDSVHVHGVKQRSCLDALPYWKVLYCSPLLF